MSFLVDTNICAAHLMQNHNVTGRFQQYAGLLHISTISLAELGAWALRRKAPTRRLQAFRDLVTDLVILDVTAEVAEMYGRLQADLLDAGKPAPAMDLMIAATAILHDLTLVTNNVSDFANVPGLRLADWLGY